MFPYKTTEPFHKLGFLSQLPKKLGNTPLSCSYLSFLDINTTVSTVLSLSQSNSYISFPLKNTGNLNFRLRRILPSACSSSYIFTSARKLFIKVFFSISVNLSYSLSKNNKNWYTLSPDIFSCLILYSLVSTSSIRVSISYISS